MDRPAVPTPCRSAVRRLLLALGVITAVMAAAACGAGGGSGAGFDPSAPCTVDVQQPGAYPELEALLPSSLDGQDPASVVSGRTCTADALGALAGAGIAELHFAGATWEAGESSGYTVAVFEAEGLEPGHVVEFYETGSRNVRPGDTYTVSATTIGDRAAVRLDIAGPDGNAQAVVAWADPAGAGGGRVRALLVANLGGAHAERLLVELAGR